MNYKNLKRMTDSAISNADWLEVPPLLMKKVLRVIGEADDIPMPKGGNVGPYLRMKRAIREMRAANER